MCFNFFIMHPGTGETRKYSGHLPSGVCVLCVRVRVRLCVCVRVCLDVCVKM